MKMKPEFKSLRGGFCGALVLVLVAQAPGGCAYAVSAEVFSAKGVGSAVRPIATQSVAKELPELSLQIAATSLAVEVAPDLEIIVQPQTPAESSAQAGGEIERAIQGGPVTSRGALVEIDDQSPSLSVRFPQLSAPSSPRAKFLRRALPQAVCGAGMLGLAGVSSSGITAGLLVLPLVMISLILHEIAHARVAYWLGDATAVADDRGSLNPKDWGTHFNLVGSVVVPVVSYWASHGLGIIGGAKPVVFHSENFHRTGPVLGSAIVGFAGPGMNLALAGLGALAFAGLGPGGILSQVVGLFTVMNAGLALFNLVPFYPLDGHLALNGILGEKLAKEINRFNKESGLLAWLPAAAFFGVIMKLNLIAWTMPKIAALLLGEAGAMSVMGHP